MSNEPNSADTAGDTQVTEPPEGWVIPEADAIAAAPTEGEELPWPAPEDGTSSVEDMVDPEAGGVDDESVPVEPEASTEAESPAEVDEQAQEQASDDAEDPASFDLPAQADIRFGADIQAQCRAAIAASGDVQVGCDAVERIDGAVLQSLIAMGIDLRQQGRSVKLVDPSVAFSRAVDLLGFADLLSGDTAAS